jgi:hypothetical protein
MDQTAAMAEERVVALSVPWLPDPDAPTPVLFADEHSAVLVYRAAVEVGSLPAIVGFPGCRATRFGYPDGDGLPGHPLYAAGLGYHGVFEVMASSWLDAIRAASPERDRPTPAGRRHFVVTFDDTVFECLADDLQGQFSYDPLVEALAVLRTLAPSRPVSPPAR